MLLLRNSQPNISIKAQQRRLAADESDFGGDLFVAISIELEFNE